MKTQSMKFAARTVCLLLTLVSISACATYRDLPGGTVKSITNSAVVSKEEVAVPTPPPTPAPSKDYQVGPGDVLLVNVNGRPEFTISSPGGGKVQGSRVDGAGFLHLPLVGKLQVAGLTITQVEQKLAAAYRKYLQEPWVVVEVADYKSMPLYLLGQFRASGTYYMDRPLTLAQGLAMGSGFDASSANLRGARLTRDGKIYPVDLADLLLHGDTRQNVWLKGGDTIYIPDNRNQQVFIFGAVKKPGAVSMPPAGLSLAQAIASAELREIGYDFRHVRIIRSLSTTRGELLVVDYDKVLKGEALPIQLMEGDVVYVPKSAFGNWNDIIAEILPSLQLVSNMLQPFVSIKYLSK